MDSLPPNFERDLSLALRREASTVVPGFSGRVVSAVQAARVRRKIIRWTSLATSLAACFVATLVVSRNRSEDFLIRQSQSLVMSDDAANFNAIFGVADDLAILAPVVEAGASAVDEITKIDI
jgi:hypothetical protein